MYNQGNAYDCRNQYTVPMSSSSNPLNDGLLWNNLMATNTPSVPSYATGNLMQPSPSPMLQAPPVFRFFNMMVAPPVNAPQMHNQSCDVQPELTTAGTAAGSTTQKEYSNIASFVTLREIGGKNDDIILGDINGNERSAGFLNILPSDFVENEKEVPPTMQSMELFLQNDQLGPLHWNADSLEAALIFTRTEKVLNSSQLSQGTDL
jgi:hypothetical protein